MVVGLTAQIWRNFNNFLFLIWTIELHWACSTATSWIIKAMSIVLLPVFSKVDKISIFYLSICSAFQIKTKAKKVQTTLPNNVNLSNTLIIVSPKSTPKTKILLHYCNIRISFRALVFVNALLIIQMYTPKRIIDIGIDISSWFEYFAHNDSLNASKRFTWILGGWGPCSVSCGGGRRQRTAACWDNQHEKIVRKKHCSLASKPFLASEKCNTFRWIPKPFCVLRCQRK